jgi:hypothetical protein
MRYQCPTSPILHPPHGIPNARTEKAHIAAPWLQSGSLALKMLRIRENYLLLFIVLLRIGEWRNAVTKILSFLPTKPDKR